MASDAPLHALGMTQEQMAAYLEELLLEEAQEAAEARGTSAETELDSPGFAAARSATSYAVRLIAANNAFLARQLLDLGVLQMPASGEPAVGDD
ncbi:MAG: hypothetical protein AVDCRST_MAG49-3671 [uncultured Thermomicrobiales bacterium]|uniref:Uncharacterized protein n=1 Tax=uncultured Thermomicrobiales bacterium TaxID=1645740 RepID=A0A6J4V7L2_9BACT|nr:MAG: hypothetical protein AVDCRST_MAG49-3671 [uncultured Thermomicrobiales bacterium]